MRVAALCAGYGGLELGLSHMGVDTELVWVSEIDKYASAVLDARFGVPNLGDLTEITDPPRVDVVTAGFPCQPVSHAGKRAGVDDERWLIRDVVSVARGAGAQWLFLENVRGVLTASGGDAFGEVLDALADGGFDARWACIRADQSVGACHRRDRWFCVAHASGAAGEERDFGPSTRVEASGGDDPSGRGIQDEARAVTHTEGVGLTRGRPARAGGDGSENDDLAVAYASGERHGGQQDVGVVGCVDRGAEGEASQRQRARQEPVDRGAAPVADADSPGRGEQCGSIPVEQKLRPPERGRSQVGWGDYADAIARWEWASGRCAPTPVIDGKLSSRFVEWMMGLPDGWVTGVGLSRSQELKMLGNGVVPQQAAAAYGWLLNNEKGE